jgi:hypothetical protein
MRRPSKSSLLLSISLSISFVRWSSVLTVNIIVGREEFASHGLDHIIQLEHRNVCKDGFGEGPSEVNAGESKSQCSRLYQAR